jgi:hypothetical protein
MYACGYNKELHGRNYLIKTLFRIGNDFAHVKIKKLNENIHWSGTVVPATRALLAAGPDPPFCSSNCVVDSFTV